MQSRHHDDTLLLELESKARAAVKKPRDRAPVSLAVPASTRAQAHLSLDSRVLKHSEAQTLPDRFDRFFPETCQQAAVRKN